MSKPSDNLLTQLIHAAIIVMCLISVDVMGIQRILGGEVVGSLIGIILGHSGGVMARSRHSNRAEDGTG